MNNNIIYHKKDSYYHKKDSYYHKKDKTTEYDNDIGKWALVKFCNYPLSILSKNTDNIPIHVLHSLE